MGAPNGGMHNRISVAVVDAIIITFAISAGIKQFIPRVMIPA